MRLCVLALLALMLSALPASALDLYVAMTGSDSNDCLSSGAPCATWQHAFNLCPSNGGACTVYVADGAYNEAAASVNYYKIVSIQGNCANLTNVVFNGIIQGQDHSIVSVNCLYTQGIYTRQYTIMDYFFVTFGANPGGIHVQAAEQSKINCLSADYTTGNAAVHMAATGLSTILANCTQTIIGGDFSTAYALASQLSLIDMGSAAFSGFSSGAKCVIGDSSIVANGANIPGTGSC